MESFMAMKGKGILKEGLKNRSPEACDASTKLPTRTSVNEGANRKDTARTPKTLGPRHA